MTSSPSKPTASGYLALVLHAHLPFVRHPEHQVSLEENWLFEAMTETYVRLFLVMEGLLADGIDFRITMSVTPTLASMLLDPLLQQRYQSRLASSLELAEKEIVRTRDQPDLQALARMYRQLLLDVRRAYLDWYGGNLIRAFKRFQDLGKLEILASAATHGYLPLLSINETAVRAQIRAGVDLYTELFDSAPKGFWLPECGYYPGVDEILASHGIRYTILETHGITQADVRPAHGVYAPLACPSGVAVFGRDPQSSRQIWSSVEGYPGDFDYREFYRDIGYDLDLDYIQPYIHPDGIRVDTGFKYYRITGPDRPKEPYVPLAASRKAALHAAHYLGGRAAQVEHLARTMDRKPVVVAPFDAELFGHWWWEGPLWIDQLARQAAAQSAVQLITPSEYLDEHPRNQLAQPSPSSWGNKGFSGVWLNRQNDWIYPHLHAAAARMQQLGAAHSGSDGILLRALEQAARELMLAQASDWAFMINTGDMVKYAAARTRNHLLRFQEIARQVETGSIDAEWLAGIEAQDNVFPQIAAAAEFLAQAPDPLPAPIPPREPVTVPSRLRIAMICSEIVPFAKTGGLADMVASLAKALDALGHEVVLVMPAYRDVLRRLPADTLQADLTSRVRVHFIREDRYFDRDYLYGAALAEYTDNAERFAFFCRAALDLLGTLAPFDILHTHDWQAALANTFLKAQPELYPALFGVRTVFTIHNQAYQGVFPAAQWPVLGLDSHLFSPQYLEFYGNINFLKAGLGSAGAVTTVSPSYAQEIQTGEYGCGLDGVLRERAADLSGILNGADYSVWNPATDPYLPRNYSPRNLAGKAVCKAELQRSLQLAVRPDVLLIGMVSRLVGQKGFDLLEQIIEPLCERDIQLVLLGAGDPHYQRFFRDAAERFRDRVRVRIVFDEALAHQIEAGADAFLMPSRYEPAGLNQLYSLKYGTIPIVRATGGLKDSIRGYHPKRSPRGNGFVFEAYEPDALLATIDRALAVFRQKTQWSRLIRNAMACDYSWDRSAAAYIDLYRKLLLR